MKTKQKEFTIRILFISIIVIGILMLFAIFTGCHKQEKDLLKNQDWTSNYGLSVSLNDYHKGSWQHQPIKWKITLKNHLSIDYPHSATQYYEINKLTEDSLVLYHSLDKMILRLHH